MSLTPTKQPGEAILSATLVTPRDPERAGRVLACAPARERAPVKKPDRVFFDPENQPRGKVGQMPPRERASIRAEATGPGLAFTVLMKICEAYHISPTELMASKGLHCLEARYEAYYMLMWACGLKVEEVAQLMFCSTGTVSGGARIHAEAHGLPRPWRRGGRPKGGPK